MSLVTTNITKTNYSTDFALWVEVTVQQLKIRDFENIDWESLIEEVESLGRSQRSAVRSYLTRLLEHLLKRCYVPMEDCYRGWEKEIRNFRQRLEIQLEDSPSLKNFILEIVPKCYAMALGNVRDDYQGIFFPDVCPFSLEIYPLLTEKFWQTSK
jgi:hypothetical protein